MVYGSTPCSAQARASVQSCEKSDTSPCGTLRNHQLYTAAETPAASEKTMPARGDRSPPMRVVSCERSRSMVAIEVRIGGDHNSVQPDEHIGQALSCAGTWPPP